MVVKDIDVWYLLLRPDKNQMVASHLFWNIEQVNSPGTVKLSRSCVFIDVPQAMWTTKIQDNSNLLHHSVPKKEKNYDQQKRLQKWLKWIQEKNLMWDNHLRWKVQKPGWKRSASGQKNLGRTVAWCLMFVTMDTHVFFCCKANEKGSRLLQCSFHRFLLALWTEQLSIRQHWSLLLLHTNTAWFMSLCSKALLLLWFTDVVIFPQ